MTSASITSTPRTPARTHRRPEPQRVYETYLAEKAIDEWGALTRTAARYRKPDGRQYSPDWARKVIKAYEDQQQQAALQEADELAYVAPPDAYPEPKPAEILPTFADESTENAAPLNPNIMSTVNEETAETRKPESPNSGLDELENGATPAAQNHTEPAPIRQPVIVRERVVVRLPAETPATRDIYSKLAALNLDTLAGPQLAIPVAILLIVLAFGLLG